MKQKMRLDNFLVEQGFFETKSKAQSAIMAGDVKLDGVPATKAGTQICPIPMPNIDIKSMKYVSRGGYKLEKALASFDIDVKDKVCLDAGASTGGFTDCLLQNGATKVYAVDVGYGQLAWKLRSDENVVVVERTNIRTCEPTDIYGELESSQFPEITVMDLSFISIIKVLENIKKLMNSEKQVIFSLIKPQFEAGKDQVPKTGVIKDKNIHFQVIKDIVDYSATIGLYPQKLTFSPIKGPAGNIEYLIHLENQKCSLDDNDIQNVVNTANEELSR